MFGSSSVKRFLATLHEGKCVWCSFFGPPSSNPNKLKPLLCFTKNFPHFRPVDKARWWWNQCNFHRLGWPGYSAPTEAPRCLNHHSDALGCAVQLLSPADSDGSDSFQRWPPVLTPIRAGWQWQTGAGSPHICWADTAEHRGGGGQAAAGSLSQHLTCASLTWGWNSYTLQAYLFSTQSTLK